MCTGVGWPSQVLVRSSSSDHYSTSTTYKLLNSAGKTAAGNVMVIIDYEYQSPVIVAE